MRLELADFPVNDIRFDKRTEYNHGVLKIDKEELLAYILEENRIASADLDVAFPSEETRILNVRDVVEPRVKVSGPGCVFPGILGPVETVGEGRTHRLSGATVMASADYRPTIISGIAAKNTAILDMWGPGAQVTPFASTINLVLILKLIDGISEVEAHAAIQLAEFRVASRLAETTRNIAPEKVEVFEISKVDPSLPRIVYILSVMTMEYDPHSHVAVYGMSIRESLPTFIHPNELLDGAVTTDARRGNGGYTLTWHYMNNPVCLELLKEHGKRLNFIGVILQRTRFQTELGKQVTAATTSQMARLLVVDGAILTVSNPAGANFMDVILTLQACERKGVKTVLITPERGGADGTDPLLLFYVPEGTAMVSTCSLEREIKLPKPKKVIGVRPGDLGQLYIGDPQFNPQEELLRDGWRDIIGGIDWFGNMGITFREY